jgi:hypothetical protein
MTALLCLNMVMSLSIIAKYERLLYANITVSLFFFFLARALWSYSAKVSCDMIVEHCHIPHNMD